MTPKQQADYNFAVTLHEQAKAMGLSDEKIIRVAETAGDLDPEAMRLYKEKYLCTPQTTGPASKR